MLHTHHHIQSLNSGFLHGCQRKLDAVIRIGFEELVDAVVSHTSRMRKAAAHTLEAMMDVHH